MKLKQPDNRLYIIKLRAESDKRRKQSEKKHHRKHVRLTRDEALARLSRLFAVMGLLSLSVLHITSVYMYPHSMHPNNDILFIGIGGTGVFLLVFALILDDIRPCMQNEVVTHTAAGPPETASHD